MLNIPMYTQYNGETKIALVDNSAIAFWELMERKGKSAKALLYDYEVILIPGWVSAEVEDSEYRKQYVEMLCAEGFPIYVILEESYTDIVGSEEGNLYKIVFASVSSLGILRSYMRRNIEREDPLEMEPYAEWITEMYRKWPVSDVVTDTGRLKKKNAGEISLTILAEIFSWYCPRAEMITVHTQDRDSYEYQVSAHKMLHETFPKRTSVGISYKSNDCLLCQMYRSSMINLKEIKEIRKDARKVIFTQRRPDQSVALTSRKLDNNQFAELLRNEGVQVIF